MRTLDETERQQLRADYDRDGYAFVRSLFSTDELAPLIGLLDDGAAPGGFSVTDSQGGKQELSVWLELGDDLIGVVPRVAPLVAVAETVVGEPVSHWHSKFSWKRPHTTSVWDWHQDYAFWADDGVARADMCTVAIALGPVTEANGCMRVVRGSHRLGVLPVVPLGPSQGADPAQVDDALQTLEIESCELETGDVVVFHSNTLHSSGPNESDLPRTMLMVSYNAQSNPPVAPRIPAYATTPLDIVPATAILDGWTSVIGTSRLIDPVADGLDQGYDTSTDPSR